MTGFLSVLSSLPLQKLTQSENINDTESKECILEGQDGGGNHDEASSGDFSKERYTELVSRRLRYV